jgi:hypothetical protein
VSIAELETRITKAVPNSSRVLVIDIERVPGQFQADFWDFNAFKGRRIHHDMVVAYPRTVCFGFRWYGQKRVGFHSEWDDGAEGMLKAAWDLYDEADIVIGHNVKGFDTKRLQGEWWPLGWGRPKPVKFVDTLTICRTQFGYESNALDAVLRRIGLQGKTDRYNVEVAKAACAGDVKAQRKIKGYNVGDIDASTLLVDALRGWIPNHPHMGNHGKTPSCNQCASEDLTLQKVELTAEVLRFPLYLCNNCRAWVAGRWHSSRSAVTKGAR